MNLFDLFFIVLAFFFGVISRFRGPIAEFASMSGVIGGMMLAEQVTLPQADRLKGLVSRPDAADLTAYLGAVGFGVILAHFLVRFLVKVKMPSSPPVRQVALLFALLKTLVVSAMIFYLVAAYVPSYLDDLESSFFYSWLSWIRPFISGAKLA
ncbi:MAG: hypothetical protein A2508_07865 [Candidatus Lambdaproteobacteria bacterium RIFOXYD12_FULL_49_8]|uniref:Colicin V production protein n=1 Tax=Candidatus Lambdaproteobacteria bacterium RIFOXYD2_FULL_50_16 TaxID=1817772 RepID=A0A1F6GAS7_9PROT|nr:MAG: hypothetical protein A2527_08595 [Candidatus Lambdaproteobacteria bacterium RIFOXYD2_FULL_50_16]OGG97595.1 MAG: hypothetical protein A2508_07865 [Candidatus Lambdaproteobacteria bacterium RIFOXYD12_FULL_49_8]